MSVFFGRGEGWVYGNSVFAIQILREGGPGGIRQCLGRNTARPWEEYGKASGGIRQPTQKCIFSCYFLGWVDMGKDGVGKLGGS